jgi:hypothetical protein
MGGVGAQPRNAGPAVSEVVFFLVWQFVRNIIGVKIEIIRTILKTGLIQDKMPM